MHAYWEHGLYSNFLLPQYLAHSRYSFSIHLSVVVISGDLLASLAPLSNTSRLIPKSAYHLQITGELFLVLLWSVRNSRYVWSNNIESPNTMIYPCCLQTWWFYLDSNNEDGNVRKSCTCSKKLLALPQFYAWTLWYYYYPTGVSWGLMRHFQVTLSYSIGGTK